MPNKKSQELRPKQKRGRKRLIREEDDADEYNSVVSDNDGESSVLMSSSASKVSKKKKWMPLTGDARKHIQTLLNAALLTSFSSTPNQIPKPEVQHVLNEVIRRIDRKLLRTLVPVSTKEKTFDREQLTSQNAALQVAVMSEVEENTILQQQIEDELRELEREENELRDLKERNQSAGHQSDRQQHTTSQNIQVDRIQDYAQALIKINQLSKPSMHLASESDDEYHSEEDGPLQRVKMSITGRLQDVDEQTAYMDVAAADIMETGHKLQSVMTSRDQVANRNLDFSDDADFI